MIRFVPSQEALARIVSVLAVALVAAVLAYSQLTGPVKSTVSVETFIASPDLTLEETGLVLKQRGLVKSVWMFEWMYVAQAGQTKIRPGAYDLSAGMDIRTLTKALSEPPALAWVRIPAGYRKEQIAERLAEALFWDEEDKAAWLAATKASETIIEGVYFPSTYMIPTDEPPAAVAARLRARFEERFLPYAVEARQEGRPWYEVLTIASMIEREAAGPHDMELIAGIIYNRLEEGMPLGIDATLQYIRGEAGSWWPVPQSKDKYLESPYNTYFKAGLPPHPIANPGLDAIAAALNPQDTGCLYYLHDYDGDIHCATTYRAHVANVDRYLR